MTESPLMTAPLTSPWHGARFFRPDEGLQRAPGARLRFTARQQFEPVEVRDRDEGIWRKVLHVPFEITGHAASARCVHPALSAGPSAETLRDPSSPLSPRQPRGT